MTTHILEILDIKLYLVSGIHPFVCQIHQLTSSMVLELSFKDQEGSGWISFPKLLYLLGTEER